MVLISLSLIIILSLNFYHKEQQEKEQLSLSNFVYPKKNYDLNSGSHGTNDFLTYENLAYGLKLKYPSYWQKTEFPDNKNNFVVGFISPSKNDSGVLENVMVQVINLPFSNSSLLNMSNNLISFYNKMYQNFDLIQTQLVKTHSNSTVYEMEYTHKSDVESIKTMEGIIMRNNLVYIIYYNADPEDYNKYLKIIQDILDSFSPVTPSSRANTISI